nr:hypothetical protein [Natrinema sp. CBA1119]
MILLFGSGKLVIIGGSQLNDTEHAIETIAVTFSDLNLL